MTRALFICTDGAVKGDFWRPRTRRLVGPACAGWCGWAGADYMAKPLFSGHEYLGDHLGPQEAEYGALINGLQAARRRLETRPHQVLEVAVQLDNRHVAGRMNDEIAVGELADWHRLAVGEVAAVEALEVSVEITKVGRKHKGVRQAHRRAQQGFSAQLPEKEWRPQREHQPRSTSSSSTTSSDSGTDIPF